MKYAKMSVVAILLLAVGYGTMWLYRVWSAPTMDMLDAQSVFDKYPYWQRNAFQSPEVVYDIAMAQEFRKRRLPPPSLKGDPFSIWQPAQPEIMTLEIGSSRIRDMGVRAKDKSFE